MTSRWNSLVRLSTDAQIRELGNILQLQLPATLDIRLRTEILHAAALLHPEGLKKLNLPVPKEKVPTPPRLLLTPPLEGSGATCKGSCVSADSYGLHPFAVCGAPVQAKDDALPLCASCRANRDPTEAKVLRMAAQSEPLPILVHILEEKNPIRRNIMMLRWRSGISGV